MLTIRELIKTLYNAFNQKLNSKLKASRGNWDQNDPTAEDYIKNRPFYIDGTKDVKLAAIQDNFLNKTDWNQPLSSYLIEGIGSFTIVPNSVYAVTYDGKKYILTAYIEKSYRNVIVGNSALVGHSGTDNGIPFAIGVYGIEETEVYAVVQAAGTHTISISKVEEKIHKLDKKYLPDDFANLAPVATSGSYNDLNDTPTIYTDVVRYDTTQSLTTDQKAQARTNINAIATADLSKVAISGDYNELENKPCSETHTYSSWETLRYINSPTSTSTGNTFDRWQTNSDVIYKHNFARAWKIYKGNSIYLETDYNFGTIGGRRFWGNASLYDASYEDTGETWCIYVDSYSTTFKKSDIGCYIQGINLSNLDATLQTSIVKSTTLIPLDEKFIPDSIQRVANMPTDHIRYTVQELTKEQKIQAKTNIGIVDPVQSDWAQKNPDSLSYIKNRVCYEDITITDSEILGFTQKEEVNNDLVTGVITYAGRGFLNPTIKSFQDPIYLVELNRYVSHHDYIGYCSDGPTVGILGNPRIFFELYNQENSFVRYDLPYIFGCSSMTLFENANIDTEEEICIVYKNLPSSENPGFQNYYKCMYLSHTIPESYDHFHFQEHDINLKQLDEKFIPDTIARTSDLHDAPIIDNTLTISGAVADAAAVGAKISQLSEEIENAVPSTDQPYMQLVTDANGNIKWDEIPEGFSGSWNDLKNKPFGNALIHSVKAIYLRKAVIQNYTEVIDGTYYYKNLTTVNFDTFPSNVAYAVVFYGLNGGEDILSAQTGTDTNTINFKIAGYDQVSIIIEEDKSLTLVMKPKATTAHSHNIKMDFTEFVTTFTKIPLDYVPTTIPTVQSAEVGQVVSVKAVDENGKPTEWETIDPWTITSPNGTQFKLTIDDEGILSATELA